MLQLRNGNLQFLLLVRQPNRGQDLRVRHENGRQEFLQIIALRPHGDILRLALDLVVIPLRDTFQKNLETQKEFLRVRFALLRRFQ